MSFKLPFIFVDDKAKNGDLIAQKELMPRQASFCAAGFDLAAANEEPIRLAPGQRNLIPTGIAIALPQGFEGQIRPRSGLAYKNGLTVLNAPGTVDADYRGEIRVLLINLGEEGVIISRGMRIAQLVIAPLCAPTWLAVTHLPDSERGENGFGSTGI